MKLSELVRPESILPNLKSREKREAIREVVMTLEGDPRVRDLDSLLEEIYAREEMESTGLGNLAALPHARTDAVSDVVLAVGRSREPIAYGGPDGDSVRILFVMGTPKRMVQEYLRAVAALARLLKQEAFRTAILEAETREEILSALERFQS